MRQLKYLFLSLLTLTTSAHAVYQIPLTYEASDDKYITQISLQDGSSSQSLWVHVDTGSPALVLPGDANTCANCPQTNTFTVNNPQKLCGNVQMSYSGGENGQAKFYPVSATIGNAPAINMKASIIVKATENKPVHAILGFSPGQGDKVKSSYMHALS